jgi:hypothetical protein
MKESVSSVDFASEGLVELNIRENHLLNGVYSGTLGVAKGRAIPQL